MSITVSNCDQICHSPTNLSKAKMLYTFSKENRFAKRRIILCDKFYDVNASATPRTTTFGYGEKYDFTKGGPKSPPPNTYNIKSQFLDASSNSLSTSPSKGFGFGCGRNQMEVTGPFVHSIKNKNPGPGTYQQKSTVVEDVITYSLGVKPDHVDHKIKVPGPGSYPVPFQLNKKGSYFLSKYKNSCIRQFKGYIQRGKTQFSKVPGPGAYSLQNKVCAFGQKQFLSSIKNSLLGRFGMSTRDHLEKKVNTPGPGNYKLPSQFGHYLSKIAVKKPQTEQIGRKNQKRQIKKTQTVQQKQNIKP